MGLEGELLQRKMWTGIAAIAMLLFLLLLTSGCNEEEGPLPGYPGAQTILPAEESERVYVLPDGRHIFFLTEAGMMLLDVATGQELPVPADIHQVTWLDDGLLYGKGYDRSRTLESVDTHYVIYIQPLSVIELERLPRDSDTLLQHARQADIIYAYADPDLVGSKYYRLLLLRLDTSGKVTGGYVVQDADNPDVLLTGIPYQIPYHPYYRNDGFPRSAPSFPSPDGKYYYTCPMQPALEVFTQEGELLNSVTVSHQVLCYGWAWDSSGVYFQQWDIHGGWGSPPTRRGPLELLPVRP